MINKEGRQSRDALRDGGWETLALMNEAYEYEKLSRTQVNFWYKRFKDGRKSIADDSRSGRPLSQQRIVILDRYVI
ncbi:GVQW3 [Cordylochernes scorpioides]|uniref:GVQW3 n=1 Tax=Cordylochernes scorpioides TaxID=51811 RepID=A0ABY6KJW9_9ARAC|nr:GVQW3 [Cordylochernes scorpioides]